MDPPAKIRKLDEVVVNRIAAGEIIQRPANALKELIENSLDAKSTNILITVKDGGLKILQIQDNGTGIRKEDMEIVCERFTTSKLQTFDDLKTISTFGFRGEALASVSHVAQLTITTKTANEKCAYKGSYIDGKLKGPLVPCAGNQGTLIHVENLFYNVATRRKALSSTSEEFSKISEVVTKYAVHNPQVGFTLKKYGETASHVRTPHSSTKINNVKILYGNSVSKELIEIDINDEKYKFKLHALVTTANYTSKKFILLLFINHRLVDSNTLRKTLEDLYSVYLPKKTHPWCYISLEIDPHNVDVNVHPTKHEVRFLHEDCIIEKIKYAIDEKLSSNDASRIFYVQSKFPTMDFEKQADETDQNTSLNAEKDKTKKLNPKDMVRTSSLDQKLEKFNFVQKNSNEGDKVENNGKYCASKKHDINTTGVTEKINNSSREQSPVKNKPETAGLIATTEIKNSSDSANSVFKSYSVNEIRVESKLLSVLQLRKEVEDSYDENLREILANSIFVGCIDDSLLLIQSGVNLFICKIRNLLEELFYEIMLYDFANYGVIKFSEPLSLHDLALLGLESEEAGWTEEDGDKEELATRVQELILEKADMLRQYFSIFIDKKGNLKSLPILLENYFPHQGRLPMYILRLSTEVNWTAEKPCFHDICRETAKFYSYVDMTEDSYKHTIEHTLFSAVKESLLPPKTLGSDSSILRIASLPELYKIFERC